MSTTRKPSTDEVIVTETGFFQNMLTGPLQVFGDKPVDACVLRGAVITFFTAGLITGGYVGRKRANEGKPAMLGFIC